MTEVTDSLTDCVGSELVDILYKNTKLNYDVCANNLIEIFDHLSIKLPQLNEISKKLMHSINKSINEKSANPDLTCLEKSFNYLREINNELQTGEKNFYECNDKIYLHLKQAIKLISEQTSPNVFKQILQQNRQSILSLFEIWQLSTNKQIKNTILRLFNICFYSDKRLIRLLYENTILACELCHLIKQEISSGENLCLSNSFKCLIIMLTNTGQIPLEFLGFLRTSDFIQLILSTIESNSNFLYQKQLNDHEEDEFIYRNRNLNNNVINLNETNSIVLDLFVNFLLSLNKKFTMPDDNVITNSIYSNIDNIHNHKLLGETIINLFNFENDPLFIYEVSTSNDDDSTQSLNAIEDLSIQYYCTNSIIKFITDLFSTSKTKNTTSIFYSNDFNVLIDIVIRKLSNLSALDQIRVDYLSMIQLIIQNSSYMQCLYRKDDLLFVFNSILNEKDQDTIDQDIIRVILSENSNLIFE